ncbi:MAG: prephenate dehydratase domain-containing protein [Hyphomonadaceae bacterium]
MPRTAFLGPAYTFTERAAHALRPDDELMAHDNVAGVIGALAQGEAENAVCALENSAAGYVDALLSALAAQTAPFAVADEHVEPIRFSLYRCEGDFGPLTAVTADVMGLKQTQGWIAAHGLEARPAESNGHAFLAVRECGASGLGAIAPADLRAEGVIATDTDLQGAGVNHTRFVLLTRPAPGETARALVQSDALAAFAKAMRPHLFKVCGPNGGFAETAWDEPVTRAALEAAARPLLLWGAGG